MRIVAGDFRGRTISAPEGDGTRPTTDRVREALFSSLFSLRGGFEGAVVLDAFAGSGALGLEALSRGAARTVFFERDAKAASVLRKNIQACKLGADAAVIEQRDALTSRMPTGHAFDLVFLDPPYKYDPADVLQMVNGHVKDGSIDQSAIIVYEHAAQAKESVSEVASELGFKVLAAKKYGKTVVTIMQPKQEDR